MFLYANLPGAGTGRPHVASADSGDPARRAGVSEQQSDGCVRPRGNHSFAAVTMGTGRPAPPSGLPISLWKRDSIVTGSTTEHDRSAGFAGSPVQSRRPLDPGLHANLEFLFQQQLPRHAGSLRAIGLGSGLWRLVFQWFTKLCLLLRAAR